MLGYSCGLDLYNALRIRDLSARSTNLTLKTTDQVRAMDEKRQPYESRMTRTRILSWCAAAVIHLGSMQHETEGSSLFGLPWKAREI
jgi:hypothetical protein